MAGTYVPEKRLWEAKLAWPDLLGLIGVFLKGAGWMFLLFALLPFLRLILPGQKAVDDAARHVVGLIEPVNYRVGEMIKWALPLLVLSVAFSVFALSIFGLSWTKLFESAEYLHASVIMLGAAATLLAGQHVRVDIFHSRMKPQSRALVDFIGFYLLLMPACLVILWDSQSFISFSWMIFEGSAEADGIRGEFLLKTLIPLFCVMMIAQGVSIALRAAMMLTGANQPDRPPHTPAFFSEQDIES